MLKSLCLSILFVLGYIIKLFYQILLGWWLSPLIASRTESKLKTEIRNDLSFLFEDFEAQFVPNETKSTWGKVVTLVSQNLRLEFAWDRGEYSVRISPLRGIAEWVPVEYALIAIHFEDPAISPIPQEVFSSISRISEILKPQYSQLEEAYGEDRFPTTKRALEKVQSHISAETTSRLEALKGSVIEAQYIWL
ncbi:MAG TPA: hypothetical protein VHS29_13355 [Candidatus Acidoferrales bacterium]|jgi:hypothetical protein|nr:hypothetical protein [Candidatus Acidoferrales bacterium]